MINDMRKLMKQLDKINVNEDIDIDVSEDIDIHRNCNDRFRALFDDLQGLMNAANDRAEKFHAHIQGIELMEELEYLIDRYSG